MNYLQHNDMVAIRADGPSEANRSFAFAQHLFGGLFLLDRFGAMGGSRGVILPQDCSEMLLQYGLTIGVDSEAYQLCRKCISNK